MKLKMFINRLKETDKETLGVLTLYSDLKKIFECKTLELPYINNKRNISCIKKGSYIVHRRWSAKHGEHLILLGVDGRSYILIHKGNFYKDTQGCILVGKQFEYINSDDELDISSSRQTFTNLMACVKENEITLQIS